MTAPVAELQATDRRARSRRTLQAVRQRLQEPSSASFGATGHVDLLTITEHEYSTTGLLRVRGPHGQRDVLAKTLAGSPGPGQHSLLQVQREYDALTRCTAIFKDRDSLRVPAPIALYPDLQCVVMDAVPGPSLASVLGEAKFWASRRRIDTAVELCRLCGRWLRCLQDATISSAPAGDLDLLDPLESEIACLASHPVPPVTDSFLTPVRSHVRRLIKRVEAQPVPIAAAHGGFAPYNVIVSPDHRAITVIDFAAFRIGTTHFDYFKFLSKLEVLAFGPIFLRSVIRRFEEAFCDGYGQRVDPDAPLSQILRIGFVLDRMTAFAENASSHPLRRRFLLRRLFREHHRWLTELCEP